MRQGKVFLKMHFVIRWLGSKLLLLPSPGNAKQVQLSGPEHSSGPLVALFQTNQKTVTVKLSPLTDLYLKIARNENP